MSKLAWIGSGILLWLATQTLAVMLAGAGHDWGMPMWVSIPLIALYPLVLVRVSAPDKNALLVDACIIVAAVALDACLTANLFMEERAYFLRVWTTGPAVVVGWVALWLIWNAACVVSLARKIQ
ncbi:hypothetical protein KX729_13680 [Rhizobium sp. XQZ8]|uniref:hypothetical protein n=1 Tax=Rhizobium populisoli TaxID=2859785 RepID=UPI001CA4A1FC|nr:hypothetical protein [Rhizobium populisoli]MBW6422503.1 hypothetical protein [Rhizobium populisoli]